MYFIDHKSAITNTNKGLKKITMVSSLKQILDPKIKNFSSYISRNPKWRIMVYDNNGIYRCDIDGIIPVILWGPGHLYLSWETHIATFRMI